MVAQPARDIHEGEFSRVIMDQDGPGESVAGFVRALGRRDDTGRPALGPRHRLQSSFNLAWDCWSGCGIAGGSLVSSVVKASARVS